MSRFRTRASKLVLFNPCIFKRAAMFWPIEEPSRQLFASRSIGNRMKREEIINRSESSKLAIALYIGCQGHNWRQRWLYPPFLALCDVWCRRRRNTSFVGHVSNLISMYKSRNFFENTWKHWFAKFNGATKHQAAHLVNLQNWLEILRRVAI